MIDAFQKVRAYGGKLGLISLAKSVRSVFEVSRLDKFFPIFEEENSAIASFRQDSPAKHFSSSWEITSSYWVKRSIFVQ
jgi:hypothetical protein